MGKETAKAFERRRHEGYFDRYLVGRGIDIGAGDDPILPESAGCMYWDIGQGDAQEVAGMEPESFDWVYSSHCLEHLRDPYRAMARWWEILKPGGWLLVVVPDEDLYEQGQYPSHYNTGHLSTFTVHKTRSWSPVSVNVTDLVASLPNHRTEWIRTLSAGYDFSGGIWDRTAGPAEAHIEALVQKVSATA